MRLLLVALFLLHTSLFATQDVSKQIKKTHKEIQNYDKKHSTLNKKMKEIAKKILASEKKLVQQEKEITELTNALKDSTSNYDANRKELAQLQDKQKLLEGKQGLIEKELIRSIARNISINALNSTDRTLTTKSIMVEEILKVLREETLLRISELDKERSINQKKISSYQQRTKKLKSSINDIDNKKAKLVKINRQNRAEIASMQKDKKRYKRSIETLMAQKRSLSNTLSRLNIIQSNEKTKAESAHKRSGKKATAKVTKKGASFQKVKSKKYRGKKTFAPLSGYKLTKKFGPYTDPIYKIKIYNESVTLQPTSRNAKVRTVLNGKVILAKKTQLLDNVVIIKHANGLHTIYAHLDQIAPTIRKGKKVKKGATIGRVNHELTFEVTQDSFHINPMTLIR